MSNSNVMIEKEIKSDDQQNNEVLTEAYFWLNYDHGGDALHIEPKEKPENDSRPEYISSRFLMQKKWMTQCPRKTANLLRVSLNHVDAEPEEDYRTQMSDITSVITVGEMKLTALLEENQDTLLSMDLNAAIGTEDFSDVCNHRTKIERFKDYKIPRYRSAEHFTAASELHTRLHRASFLPFVFTSLSIKNLFSTPPQKLLELRKELHENLSTILPNSYLSEKMDFPRISKSSIPLNVLSEKSKFLSSDQLIFEIFLSRVFLGSNLRNNSIDSLLSTQENELLSHEELNNPKSKINKNFRDIANHEKQIIDGLEDLLFSSGSEFLTSSDDEDDYHINTESGIKKNYNTPVFLTEQGIHYDSRRQSSIQASRLILSESLLRVEILQLISNIPDNFKKQLNDISYSYDIQDIISLISDIEPGIRDISQQCVLYDIDIYSVLRDILVERNEKKYIDEFFQHIPSFKNRENQLSELSYNLKTEHMAFASYSNGCKTNIIL